MKKISILILANWYLSSANATMEEICSDILQIKSDANLGIIPKKSTRVKLIKLTDKACIYLNKAAKFNPEMNISKEIQIRNEIIEFIYN